MAMLMLSRGRVRWICNQCNRINPSSIKKPPEHLFSDALHSVSLTKLDFHCFDGHTLLNDDCQKNDDDDFDDDDDVDDDDGDDDDVDDDDNQNDKNAGCSKHRPHQ